MARTTVRRAAITIVVAFSVIVMVGVCGVGWYFSGVAMKVDHADDFDIDVLAVDSRTVTLERTIETARPGRFGLHGKAHDAVIGAIESEDSSTVTRLLDAPTELVAGDKISWEADVWAADPRSAVGLEYQDVEVPSSVGELPAWFLPGNDDTWVLAVHGRNGSRGEALRVLPALASTGMPVLVLSYRNDEGAPSAGGGKGHLGASEWHDVEAAISYAKANGATNVVLYGWSMGGAMVTRTLFGSDEAAMIRALVLDAPVMDWRDTLDSQARDRGLPLPVTRVAERILSRRSGLDYRDFDQIEQADELRVPVLVFYGREDDYVPSGPAEAFAAERPDLVKLEWFDHAGHTESWNVDSQRYEQELLAFLQPLQDAPGGAVDP